MIRNIVSSKHETDCIYLQCDSGNKIVKIYHYPRTTTCEEIFLLDYIGIIDDQELLTYKHFNIKKHVTSIVETLKSCYSNPYYTNEFVDANRLLKIMKDESNITKIQLYHIYENKKKVQQRDIVWTVNIRLDELQEFTTLLEELLNKVKEVNSNIINSNIDTTIKCNMT